MPRLHLFNTMKAIVHLLPFSKGDCITSYDVAIPEAVAGRGERLSYVFEVANGIVHGVPPPAVRSMSVGDLVQFPEAQTAFVCMSIGWREVAQSESDALAAMAFDERLGWVLNQGANGFLDG